MTVDKKNVAWTLTTIGAILAITVSWSALGYPGRPALASELKELKEETIKLFEEVIAITQQSELTRLLSSKQDIKDDIGQIRREMSIRESDGDDVPNIFFEQLLEKESKLEIRNIEIQLLLQELGLAAIDGL